MLGASACVDLEFRVQGARPRFSLYGALWASGAQISSQHVSMLGFGTLWGVETFRLISIDPLKLRSEFVVFLGGIYVSFFP